MSSVRVKVVDLRSRLPCQKCFRCIFGLMELDELMGLHSDVDTSSHLLQIIDEAAEEATEEFYCRDMTQGGFKAYMVLYV